MPIVVQPFAHQGFLGRRPAPEVVINEGREELRAIHLANAGAAVLAQSAKVSSRRELDAQDGLPSLLPVDLVLWRREPGILPAADHLADHIANDVGEISKGIR